MALGLAGFMGCSDDVKPGPSHSSDAGTSGQSDGVGCPAEVTKLRDLVGKPCDDEGARCPASGPVTGGNFTHECNEGRWEPIEGEGGSFNGEGGGMGGETALVSAGEGGTAGKGGAVGGMAGEVAVTVAGEGGIESAGEGGIAGEGGAGVGDSGIESAPVDSASIVLLELEQRPYTECETYTKGASYAQDAEGIPLKPYDGSFYYNPVIIAQAGLIWLACYRQSSDEWYLDQARKAGNKLVSMSEDFDGAMFFPYPIDFRLHGSSTQIAYAPWYSGMAQGQVLSLLSRLGELTSEPEWEVAADATALSFDRARGEAAPWIMDLDEENSLWIEEYADTLEMRVLNGFMFGMFGLYDYYAWRDDAHTAHVFLQALHTLRVNAERFRIPGEVSAYCLTHRRQNAGYHGIHIWQLQAISRMTDDPYFASVADLLAADHAP